MVETAVHVQDMGSNLSTIEMTFVFQFMGFDIYINAPLAVALQVKPSMTQIQGSITLTQTSMQAKHECI